MFTPNGTVYLLNVPFNGDLRSTIWFPDVQTQQSYFLGRRRFSFDNYNYVRKDSTLTISGNVDTYWECNYCMYRNTNFTNKWFYAFITKIEWVSANSAKLYLSTDPIQTWFFDITYYTSFISRQHSVTDSPGDNIQPEPISGSRVKYQTYDAKNCKPDAITLFATCHSDGTPINAGQSGSVLNGIYSGSKSAVFCKTDAVAPIEQELNDYVNNGLASAVSKIQQYPSLESSGQLPSDLDANWPKHPTSIDGYIPKNNKLLSGEFCHGFVSGFGQQIEFIPEFCLGNGVTVSFRVDITTGSMYVYVGDYGMVSDESTSIGGNTQLGFLVKFPEATWAYNQYKNDYNLHNGSNSMLTTRLKANRNVGAINSVLGIAEGSAQIADAALNSANSVMTLGLGGDFDLSSAASGASQIVNSGANFLSYIGGYDEITEQLARMNESYSAPSVGNVASSNPYIASGLTYVKYGWLVPPAELAERMDNYLTVYGYAQDRYAVPNLHARKCWTYLQVPELMFDCRSPDEDAEAIKKAFKNGIFFWAYNATYGDFNQDNGLL